MKQIRKVLLWSNPTSVGQGPRWDAEVVYDDKSHERISRITKARALKLIGEAMR